MLSVLMQKFLTEFLTKQVTPAPSWDRYPFISDTLFKTLSSSLVSLNPIVVTFVS